MYLQLQSKYLHAIADLLPMWKCKDGVVCWFIKWTPVGPYLGDPVLLLRSKTIISKVFIHFHTKLKDSNQSLNLFASQQAVFLKIKLYLPGIIIFATIQGSSCDYRFNSVGMRTKRMISIEKALPEQGEVGFC